MPMSAKAVETSRERSAGVAAEPAPTALRNAASSSGEERSDASVGVEHAFAPQVRRGVERTVRRLVGRVARAHRAERGDDAVDAPGVDARARAIGAGDDLAFLGRRLTE